MPKDTKPTARQVTQRNARKESALEQKAALAENDYSIKGYPGMRAVAEMDKAASQGRLTRPATAAMNRVLALKALESARVQDSKKVAAQQKAKMEVEIDELGDMFGKMGRARRKKGRKTRRRA